MMTRN